MKMYAGLCSLFLTAQFFLLITANGQQQAGIKITFINTINGVPVVLDSVNYTNCWNETFTISKLKYYISNIKFRVKGEKEITEKNSYHLVNEEDTASKSFIAHVPPANYTAIMLTIGVDSLKNVSGAQTDALDPLNGMFWTWHTGYIMFKLEGNSPQSTSINNKIEYHIGGFTGTSNVLRNVELPLEQSPVLLKKQRIAEIIIGVDIGKIWYSKTILKIAGTPACMTPGPLSARIADNYAKAFEIIKVVYH